MQLGQGCNQHMQADESVTCTCAILVFLINAHDVIPSWFACVQVCVHKGTVKTLQSDTRWGLKYVGLEGCQITE